LVKFGKIPYDVEEVEGIPPSTML